MPPRRRTVLRTQRHRILLRRRHHTRPHRQSNRGRRGALCPGVDRIIPRVAAAPGACQRAPSGRTEAEGLARRPGSVPASPYGSAGGDHPSRAAVAGHLVRSTSALGRAALERAHAARRNGRRLDLAPGGVCRATPVTRRAGGLLHRRFTLTARRAERRSALCGTVPQVALGGGYPPPRPVEPGPSSARP
jgi:hypothetical protein